MNRTRSYEQQQGAMESTTPLLALIDFIDLDLHDKCAILSKCPSIRGLCTVGLLCVDGPRKILDE